MEIALFFFFHMVLYAFINFGCSSEWLCLLVGECRRDTCGWPWSRAIFLLLYTIWHFMDTFASRITSLNNLL